MRQGLKSRHETRTTGRYFIVQRSKGLMRQAGLEVDSAGAGNTGDEDKYTGMQKQVSNHKNYDA